MGRKGNPNAPALLSHSTAAKHLSIQHSDLVICLQDGTQLHALSLPAREGLAPLKGDRGGDSTQLPNTQHYTCSHPTSWDLAQEKGRRQSLDTPSPPCAREPALTDFHENSVEYSPTKGA